MKYYAVTNDPAELMHYGIKGMKWGVIRTDAQLGHPSKPKKPRSAAYKKAESKLGKMMKSGINKAKANWAEHNSPENKAFRAYKRDVNRENRAINRAEKRFEKHLQKAREGRLRYKGISDAEVSRITDRLALERQARQLSATEKQSFGRRLKASIGEGVVQGVGSGVGRSISERISRGSTLKTDRLREEQRDSFERAREKRRIKNARKEAEYKAEREFEQQRRKDEYEHERDLGYERERARNAYLYDVDYDKDGNISGEGSYAKLYSGKYADSDKEIQRSRNAYAKQIAKRDAATRKEDERQKRIEARNWKREYSAQVKRVEAFNKREAEEARQRELDRYRSGMKRLSEEASKRDAERAWRDKTSRINDKRATESYRQRITGWASDIDSGTDVAYGRYTANNRRRRRRGYH